MSVKCVVPQSSLEQKENCTWFLHTPCNMKRNAPESEKMSLIKNKKYSNVHILSYATSAIKFNVITCQFKFMSYVSSHFRF